MPVERSAGGGGGFVSPLTTKGDIYGHSTVDARIPVGSDHQVLTAASGQALGVDYEYPPALEISYDQITASVNITSTNPASPTTVITGSSHVYDGSAVMVQFYAPAVSAPAVVGSQIIISLAMDGTELGRGLFSAGTNTSFASNNGAANVWLRTTPGAGSHAFSVTGVVQSTTGTPNVTCGAGGAGNPLPAFLRVTKV